MKALPSIEFAAEVYAVVAQIPRGKVATYGQVALLAGAPLHARLAGRVLSKAPAGAPCHRVVNRLGRPAPGWAEQRALLEAEGVCFKSNGCVDLTRCGWNPSER